MGTMAAKSIRNNEFNTLLLQCYLKQHNQIICFHFFPLANNFFAGNRYVLKNDTATMLLFDSNGKIAGIQMGVSPPQPIHRSIKYRLIYTSILAGLRRRSKYLCFH